MDNNTEEDSINNNLKPCACGCGELIKAFDKDKIPRRFKPNHHLRLLNKRPVSQETKKKLSEMRKGDKHWNWQGGRGGHSGGYLRVFDAETNTRDHRVLEHRQIMEEYLGRKLEAWEHIHHKNENKKDNRVENLQITTNPEHRQLHKKDMTDRRCYECNQISQEYYKKTQVWRKHPLIEDSFVCKKCYDRIKRRMKN